MAIKKKDHYIFNFLFIQYNEALIKGAIKRGLAFDQAESVVQSVWSDFYEFSEKFEGRSHIRTYLFGMMKNKCFETFRNNLRYTKYQLEDQAEDRSEIEEITIAKDLYENVKSQLVDIPTVQKDIFLKKEYEGYSPKELATQYDYNANHIAIISHRVKQSIRKYIMEVA